MNTTASVTNERPSDTSSLTSSAVTSLAGATDRLSSLAGNSAVSSAMTDETILSWTGSALPDKVLHYPFSLTLHGGPKSKPPIKFLSQLHQIKRPIFTWHTQH